MKAVGRGPYAVAGLLQGGEHSRHMLQEQLARPRQACAAAGADEQLLAKVFFQLLDGTRQRRLLNMQPLGRSGEVEFFGNSHKAAQMA